MSDALPALRPLPDRLIDDRGHAQPDPHSYSRAQLVGMLLANYIGMSPAQCAAVRLLADHRSLLDCPILRHVGILVLGWKPGDPLPDPVTWSRDWQTHTCGPQRVTAVIAWNELGQAVQDDRLPLSDSAAVVLAMAGMIDRNGAQFHRLDAGNLAGIVTGIVAAAGRTGMILGFEGDRFCFSGTDPAAGGL